MRPAVQRPDTCGHPLVEADCAACETACARCCCGRRCRRVTVTEMFSKQSSTGVVWSLSIRRTGCRLSLYFCCVLVGGVSAPEVNLFALVAIVSDAQIRYSRTAAMSAKTVVSRRESGAGEVLLQWQSYPIRPRSIYCPHAHVQRRTLADGSLLYARRRRMSRRVLWANSL